MMGLGLMSFFPRQDRTCFFMGAGRTEDNDTYVIYHDALGPLPPPPPPPQPFHHPVEAMLQSRLSVDVLVWDRRRKKVVSRRRCRRRRRGSSSSSNSSSSGGDGTFCGILNRKHI